MLRMDVLVLVCSLFKNEKYLSVKKCINDIHINK